MERPLVLLAGLALLAISASALAQENYVVGTWDSVATANGAQVLVTTVISAGNATDLSSMERG